MAHCKSDPQSSDVHFVMLTVKMQVLPVIRVFLHIRHYEEHQRPTPTKVEAATHAH